MADREKLIEVLKGYRADPPCDTCEHPIGHCDRCGLDRLADFLFANGVTIQPLTNCQQSVAYKWISTAERLPQEDIRVLVWLTDGVNSYTKMDTDRRHNNRWVRWGKYVTHWMPLPEAPKGE